MSLIEFFVIGKIVKPSGFRGRLKALSYLESNDIIQSLDEIYVEQGEDTTGPFKLRKIQVKGRTFFLEIEGVEDIESAKNLSGCQVLVPKSILEELSEGEYYWRDIIGLKVVTEDGNVLGIVENILPTGGNDVYVCGGGEREILLPAISDVVRKIDIKQGMMVVRLLEGL